MAEQILCPRCHATNDLGVGFCKKCGTSLESENARASEDPLIGAFVGERFLVKRKLGEGGMGIVYEAEQTAIDRRVALKVLHPHLTDESLYARFRNEAAACSRLSHPNTITVYDFGKTDQGSLYIAMEFIEGVSLDDEISRSGALDWKRTCKIGAQICGSLENAHSNGIVHRDLKPENVMLCERGSEKDIVKVLDFGIAKILEDDGKDQRKALTKTGMVFGTPQYMSPEQVRGEKVDARSDIYSTGVILYQTLTGVLPFRSETPMGVLTMHLLNTPDPFSKANSQVSIPQELEELVNSTLAKSVNDRPQTMKELGEKLEAILHSSGEPARQAPMSGGRPTAITQPASMPVGQDFTTESGVASTFQSPQRIVPPTTKTGKKGKGPVIGIVLGATVLLIGGAVLAWYFVWGPGRAPAKPAYQMGQIAAPPVYAQPLVNVPPVAVVTTPSSVSSLPVDTDTNAGQESLSAAPPTAAELGKNEGETKSHGSTGGTTTSQPKKDADCNIVPVDDKIAKAMADKLKANQSKIKSCALLVKDKAGSVLNFKVKDQATQPTAVQSGSTPLDRCLSGVVQQNFDDTNDKDRAGKATFDFSRDKGALSECKVNVDCKPVEKKDRQVAKPEPKTETSPPESSGTKKRGFLKIKKNPR